MKEGRTVLLKHPAKLPQLQATGAVVRRGTAEQLLVTCELTVATHRNEANCHRNDEAYG